MLDEPTMSDQTLLLSVEDLINLAMGPIAGNTVDFKMLKTILHILARQMRLLEQKVILEVGELPQSPVLRLSRRDTDGSQSTSTESKEKEAAKTTKRAFGDIKEERRDGDKDEESEGSELDSYEMEAKREEAQKARDKDIYKDIKAERDKERAEIEKAKMENMNPAEREEYKKELQKEQERRQKAEKLAKEEEERAENEARAQREIERAEREKVKAERKRLRQEKEEEIAEREREIAERETEKMKKMKPSERKDYKEKLESEKEYRLKALRIALDEEERAEKEKERAAIDKVRAVKEKERAERERSKMENMSPREKENYQKKLEKLEAEREEERRKVEQMDSEEREQYEINQHKERERNRLEKMTPSEKEIYEQEVQKKKDEKEKVKMEKMNPREREQYMEEKEKLAKLEKMTPKERENYEKEQQKVIAEKEKEKLERMSPKEREKYQKEQQKEIAEKEKDKLEKMSPKEREKYEKQQQKEIDEKEQAKLEKMNPRERETYEKELQKEKEKAEKEKAKIEKMSPKEREKYEQQQQKEIDEKEQAKLEKMSPRDREKFEKELQKEKEKAEKEKAKIEKISPRDREKFEKELQKEKEKAEKEKAKIEKMSPKEREKYEQEQRKEKAEKEKEKLERMSPKEREKYEKEQREEKERAEKEKAKLEKMSPKERQKYEKEQREEKEKAEKEKAKLEKMSPKEREKYEKEQQKEKEKMAQRELEEKAKMDKMSPQEREKYLKEKEKAEGEARDKARVEDSARLGDVVESISERYDAKLKEKVLVVEKGSASGRGSEPKSRRSSIEVVTRSQFALLEAAVEALKENASPLPALTLPENSQLRIDLAKGNLSLTDAMMAMQVSARVQAAEQAIGRLGGVLTQLAGQGVVPGDDASARAGDTGRAGDQGRTDDQGRTGDTGRAGHPSRARGYEAGPADSEGGLDERAPRAARLPAKASPSMEPRRSVHTKEMDMGMGMGSRPSRSSTATAMGLGMTSVSKSLANMALTQYEMDAALDALRKELMEKVNAITSRALTSAETTSNLAKAVAEKMDTALKIDGRITALNALVSDYTDQLAGFDSGLTTQMQSFREQITQMRGDLTAGLALLESANNNAETAALMELTERYEELVNGLDNTLLAHQALAAFQDQLNLDFRSLLESVEMLREQKADRDEVIDGLRDKADNERLAGLLREDDFNEARAELDERLAVCHDKFRKQDAAWVAALKELTGVVQRKAEHTDLMKTRQETTEQLQEIDDKIKRLAFILGEPKAAILTRQMAKDAVCAVCMAPAVMEPENVAPQQRPRPVRGAPTPEQPCLPDWKPPEAPDLRTHTCLRWVGGSHTLLSAVRRGQCEQSLAPRSATHKYLGQGDDGQLYAMESELGPCEECNKPDPAPLHCSEGGPCLNTE